MYPYQDPTINSGGLNGTRIAVVPALDPDCSSDSTSTVPALTTFSIRQRDALDFTVDFSAWLSANSGGMLSAAVFALAVGSPGTPVIASQGFNPSGACVVVLRPAATAKPGDAYWLDITANIAAIAATVNNPVALPQRTLTRRINFVVVAG